MGSVDMSWDCMAGVRLNDRMEFSSPHGCQHGGWDLNCEVDLVKTFVFDTNSSWQLSLMIHRPCMLVWHLTCKFYLRNSHGAFGDLRQSRLGQFVYINSDVDLLFRATDSRLHCNKPLASGSSTSCNYALIYVLCFLYLSVRESHDQNCYLLLCTSTTWQHVPLCTRENSVEDMWQWDGRSPRLQEV